MACSFDSVSDRVSLKSSIHAEGEAAAVKEAEEGEDGTMRAALVTMEELQERVARGDNLPLKFTHRSDAKLVSQLQEEVLRSWGTCQRREWKGLRWMRIGSDNIGDVGAASLAAAVLECKKLTEFQLHKCHMIGDAGVAALAAAKGGQWELSLSLLAAAFSAGAGSRASQNAAISACEKGNRWQQPGFG
ncbi:hypothetical protein AK812_SmicGene9920 [Symbiodinium microadriaticum]|uniref:Uncharacterized protein n=1 Tax=Symbiodinium microadriaticum TaxID=2951 RepID=A0A1Q9EH71_SYMMI|nr:hypothetical protein AK812_SmicGene9920 [Symbiodinium microadriaticum]